MFELASSHIAESSPCTCRNSTWVENQPFAYELYFIKMLIGYAGKLLRKW